MQVIGPAAPAPSIDELIQMCGPAIKDVMRDELSDYNDPDRIWILRRIHKNYLYYRNLQYFAPSLYQGLLDVTSIMGTGNQGNDEGYGLYDYSQNIYRGYCRKLEAVLGNRMPNAIAVPDNAEDEEAIRGTKSANAAALYIRQKCNLQLQSLYQIFGLFNFGTMFWHFEMVEDGDKNGFKQVPNVQAQQAPLGNAAFQCPNCANATPVEDPDSVPDSMNCSQCGSSMDQSAYQPPTMADVPQTTMNQVPKKGLEIGLHAADEVSVPLDSTCVNTAPWLRLDREKHKSGLLKKWRAKLGDKAEGNSGGDENTTAQQYAEQIRSAMGSPIGLVRSSRENQWTQSDTWWTPDMFEMVSDSKYPGVRQMLIDNFPKGLRYTEVKGTIVDMMGEGLAAVWEDVKPEPAKRIMADPLGDDWTETQDIHTNTLNQCNEIVERSNQAGYADPTRVDFDALQNRRSLPAEMIPALRPPGGSLGDIIFQPQPLEFSQQIPAFRIQVVSDSESNSGLLPAIWGGGDAEEPTARQAELKKNAALQQLGVTWSMIGHGLEGLYLKVCKLLAEYEDGVIAFSKKNQFGRYDQLSIVIDDLKNAKYHFEADEAIPMTWGQQRDLLMWMLDKPAELLNQWGLDDPLNIVEFKQLLGMPGERTPGLDMREKCMDVITKLLADKPQPGPPDPQTQQPGPLQSSIQPDWEDDHDFCAKMVKAWMIVNSDLKTMSPDGFQNVQLYGQAQFQMANVPPPPAPPKTSVAVSIKGEDMGSPGVADMLLKEGIIDKGTAIQSNVDKQLAMMPPPPSAAPLPQNPQPPLQPGPATPSPIQ